MELGKRGRMYLEHYGNHAKRLEDDQPGLFAAGILRGLMENSTTEVWPCQFEVKGLSFGKSKHILRWGPLVFTGLYAVLAIITYFSSCA